MRELILSSVCSSKIIRNMQSLSFTWCRRKNKTYGFGIPHGKDFYGDKDVECGGSE